jgi:epoxyqueuosine reductase
MIAQIIQDFLEPSEEYIYGFADLNGMISGPYSSYYYGISIGKKLDSKIVESISKGLAIEYYDHYKLVNRELQELSESIVIKMNQSGFDAITVRPSITTNELSSYYNQNTNNPLSHKMVATRAGLGWIGKTGLFVSHQFGPRIRLVSILTTSPLIPQFLPVQKSLCGNCNICVDECPASAANGKLWDISVDRDEFYNAQKCKNKTWEFEKGKFSANTSICGACVSVCPIGLESGN